MYSLHTNITQRIKQLHSRLLQHSDRQKINSMVEASLTATIEQMKTRIHRDGIAADDTAIGSYSTRPIYVPASSYGFAPIGKAGKLQFRSGYWHRDRYFSGGYMDFKTAMSTTASGSVNLLLTGRLRDSYAVIPSGDSIGLGWRDTQSALRAAALENKYGKKIWSLSAYERQQLLSHLQTQILHVLTRNPN